MKEKSSRIKANLSMARGSQPPQTPDQNVVFGSSAKPEGFVETWKKASHLWRWRAVLCLFMALLLAMMQPSGNALYRSWGAAGEDLANSLSAYAGDNGLAVGTASLRTGEGATTEGTPLTINSSSTAHFLPSWEYAFDLENYRIKTGSTTINSVEYAVFGALQSGREWAKPFTGNLTGEAHVVTATPTAANHQYGALSLLENTSSYQSADYTNGEAVEYTHTFGSGVNVPKTMFWYMGYKPYSWIAPNMKSLTTATPGVLEGSTDRVNVLAPFGDITYNGVMDMTKYATTVAYNSNATSSTLDKYFYGSWDAASDYSVQVFMPATKASNSPVSIATFSDLSWDSTVNIYDAYYATDAGKQGGWDAEREEVVGTYWYLLTKTNLSWLVYTVSNSELGSQTGTVFTGNTPTLGEIANPHSLTDAQYDPAYWNNKYGGTSGATSSTLGLYPGLSISYYANGGTVTNEAATRTIQPLSMNGGMYDAGTSSTNWDLRAKTNIPSAWRTVKANPADVGISAVDAEGNQLTFLGWADSPTADAPTYTAGQSLTDANGDITDSVALYAVWGASYDVTVTPEYTDASDNTTTGTPITIKDVPQGTALSDITFDGSTYVYSTAGDASEMTAEGLGFALDGYTVSGWSGSGITGTVAELPNDVRVSGDMTLTLSFGATRTVSFWDGDTLLDTVQVAKGDKVARPEDPTKEGFTFVEWCADSQLTTAFSFDGAITANTNVYAKWDTKICVVTLDANPADGDSAAHPGHFGDSVLDTTQQRLVQYGGSLDLGSIIAPVRMGYRFIYWAVDGTQVPGGTLTNVTDDVTVSAEWEILEYDVTFDGNGGYVDSGQTQTQVVKEDVANITDTSYNLATSGVSPSRTGYDFAGWYTMPIGGDLVYDPNASPAMSTTIQVTDDTWLYAHWSEKSTEHPDSFELTLYATDSMGFFYEDPDEEGYDLFTKTITVNYGASVVDSFPGGESALESWLSEDENDDNTNYIDPSDDLDGYSLGWWTDDEGTETLVGLRSAITEDYGALYSIQGRKGASSGTYYYYVTFNSNNTAATAEQQLVSSDADLLVSTATVPAADSGKVFAGWYTANIGGIRVSTVKAVESDPDQTSGNPYEIDENTTLYAHWDDLSYTVRFMDGTSTLSTASVIANQTVSKPSDPSKVGYVFDGWYTTSALTTPVNFSAPITEDTMYFAKWTPASVTYTVRFYDGSTELSTYTTAVSEGGKVARPAIDPTKSGVVFDDWYTTAALTTKFDFDNTPINSNTNIYAGWNEKCTVTYKSQDGSTTITSVDVAKGTVLNTLANAPKRNGYSFVGWYTAAEGGDAVTAPVTISSNVTYFARYSADSYTITCNLDGGTLATANPANYTVESEPITLNEPSKDGYTFTGWSGTGLTGSANKNVTIATGSTGNRTYTAHYSKETYTITYDLGGGSLASGVTNPSSYDVESGAITLNNPTKANSQFAGWTGTGLTEATMTVVIPAGSSGDRAYTATWADNPDHTVTFNWNNGSTPATTPVTQNSGTFEAPASSSAPTLSGYRFVGWSSTQIDKDSATRTDYAGGAYTYTPVSYSTEMTDDQVFYAVWEPVVVVEATKASGSPSSANVTSTKYSVGAVTGKVANGNTFSATFTASPTDLSGNAQFYRWSDNVGAEQQTSASITVGPGNLASNASKDQYAATTFTATFQPVHTITFKLGTGAAWRDGTTGDKTLKKVDSDSLALSEFPLTDPLEGYSGTVQWGSLVATVTEDATYTATYNGLTPELTFKLADGVDSNEYRLSTSTATVAYDHAMTASEFPVLQKKKGTNWVTVTTANDARYTGALTWSPTLEVGTTIKADGVYTATPVEQTKTVKVTVVNGKFADNTTTHSYSNVAYGASTNAIANLVSDVNGIVANTGYDKNSKTWSGNVDPTASGTKVEPSEPGEVVYQLTLGSEKHTATFELSADSLYSDAQLSGALTVPNVEYNSTISATNGSYALPTLAKKSGTDAAYNQKYGSTPSVTWTIKGTSTTVADPLTYTMTADTTFVATPVLADVTITLVKGTGMAKWPDGTADNSKTFTVKYGDNLSTHIPDMSKALAATGYKQNSGTWDVDPTVVTNFAGANTTFTYSYSAAKADTLKIVNGTWDGVNDTKTVDNSASDSATITADFVNSIVTNVHPNNGYTPVGYWSTDPSGEAITGGATYTYTLYEACTVTLKVENGTWSDGTTADIVYTVPKSLALSQGYLSSSFSTKFSQPSVQANAGWSTTGDNAGWYLNSASSPVGTSLPAVTPVNANQVYTYKMAVGQAGYTINVYKQNVSGNTVSTDPTTGYTKDNALSTTATAMTGSNINWKNTFTMPTGFSYSTINAQPSSGDTVTLDGDASNNVWNVYLDRNQYKVTYDWGSTDIPAGMILPTDTNDYYFGATVPVQSVGSVPAGYTFSGWISSATSSTVSGTTTMSTAGLTLTGAWSRGTVPVKFDFGAGMSGDGRTIDGQTTAKTVNVKVGDTVTFPTAASTATSEFRRWTTNQSSAETDAVDSASFVVTSEWFGNHPSGITYYAWWTDKAVIRYLHDDENVATFEVPATAYVETAGTVPAPPTESHKTGYIFKGWTVPAGTKYLDGSTVQTLASDTVITSTNDLYGKIIGKAPQSSIDFVATYEGLDHTLTIAASTVGTDVTENTYTVPTGLKTGSDVKLPSRAQLKKTGYTLAGFNVVCTDDDSGAGYGESREINGTTYPHFLEPEATFEVLCTSTSDTQLSTPHSITATPIWTANTHTVTVRFVADEGTPTLPSTVTVDSNAHALTFTVPYGSTFSLSNTSSATEVTGYNFAGYEVTAGASSVSTETGTNGRGDTYSFIMGNENVTVTGTYKIKKYELRYSVPGTYAASSGSIALSPASPQTVSYGANVDTTLSGVTVSGYDGQKYTNAITWTKPAGLTTAGSADPETSGAVAGTKGYYTITGDLAERKYSITLTVENGTYNNQSAKQTLTLNVTYGTTISDALKAAGFDSTKLVPTETTAMAVWSPYDPTATANSGTQVTGNVDFTVTYTPSYTVKFVMVGGTWDGTSATTEYQVMQGQTLASAGKSIPTPDSAYRTTSTGYATTGSWDSLPADTLPIMANQTYTYTWDKANVGYTVEKYYQQISNLNSYLMDSSKTVSGSAPYLSTVSTASLGADAQAANAIYGDTPVDNVSSISSIEVSDTAASNRLILFYDLIDVSYSYTWTGDAPSTAALPSAGSVKYGNSFEVAAAPANDENKVFSGWKVESTPVADLNTADYTYSGGRLTLKRDVVLSGEWTTAERMVKYTIDPTVDSSSYGSPDNSTSNIENGAVAIWTSADETIPTSGTDVLVISSSMTPITKLVNDNALAPTAKRGVTSTAIDPAVTATVDGTVKTYVYSDKYAFSHWTYHVGDDTTEQGPIGDPSEVRVTGGDYTFTAHFKLKTSTITYSAGDKCNPLSGEEGKTVFTGVKFGEPIPWPVGDGNDGISATNTRNASVQSDLSESYTVDSPYWQSSPSGFWATVETSGLVNQAYEPTIAFTPVIKEKPYEVYFYLTPESTPLPESVTPNVANGTGGGDANGPTYSESVFKNLKGAYSTIATPTSTNAAFNGWKVGYIGGTVTAKPATVEEIATAYAAAKGTLSGDFTVSQAVSLSGADKAKSNKLLVFAAWTANPTNLAYHSLNPVTGDKTFTKTVGLSVGDNETVESNTTIATAASNNDVKTSFRSATGYTFLGWAATQEAARSYVPPSGEDPDTTLIAAGASYGPLGAIDTNALWGVWKPNTFTVKWLDAANNEIAESTVSVAYSATGYLNAPETSAVTSDASAVVQSWTSSTGDVFAGDVAGGTLTTKPQTDGAVVTMTPSIPGSVTLTYAAGDGTFTVGSGSEASTATTWPETKAKSLDGFTTASFDLDAAATSLNPTRAGYEFKGWSTDGTVANVITTSTGDYRISSNTVLRAAYAPVRVQYKVQRYYEQTKGARDYEPGTEADDQYTLWADTGIEIQGLTGGYDAETGGSQVTVSATSGVVANTYKGYSYNATQTGATTVTPAAGTVQEVALYYDIKDYTVTYSFSGLEDGDAAKYAPNPASVSVQSGQTYEFAAVPAAPTGYSSLKSAWQYTTKNGASATGDAAGQITVTGDTVVYLPLQIRTFTVTYAVDPAAPYNSAWKVDPGSATTEQVTAGHTPQNADTYQTQTSQTVGDWAPIGWYVSPYHEGDTPVNPAGYTVMGDVMFIAAYAQVQTVSYMQGNHPKTPFSSLFTKTIFDGTVLTTATYDVTKVALAYKATGQVADLSNLEAEDGYEFTGWRVENLSNGEIFNNVKPGDANWPFNGETASASYTLTAQWQESEQDITFLYGDHAAGGNEANAAFTTVSGRTNTQATIPAGPEAVANYAFDQWTRVSGNGLPTLKLETETSKFTVPTLDTVYEATYIPETSDIQITTDGNGTVSRDSIKVDKVENEDAVTGYDVKPTAKPGYHFAGWTKDNGNNEYVAYAGDANGTIAEDGTLTVKADGDGVLNNAKYKATFAKDTYAVTFVNAEGDASGPTGTYSVSYGTDPAATSLNVEHGSTIGNSITIADLEGAGGATFAGWSYTMGGAEVSLENAGLTTRDSYKTLTITGATELKAHWVYSAATLTLSKGTAEGVTGAASGWPEAAGKHIGETVNLGDVSNTLAREGYEQIGWSTTDGATTPDYDMDDDYTFTAASATMYPVWSRGTVEVVYHANYTQLSSTANPADDTTSVQVAYGATDATAAACSFSPISYQRADDNVVVPAEAVELKYWSTTPADPGEGAGTTYKEGGTLDATNLEGRLDLFAIWQDKTFEISFDGNGATSGGNPASVAVKYGKWAAIPANPYQKTDYTFAYWYVADPGEGLAKAGNSTGEATSYEFRATHDLTFQAHWNILPGLVNTITVQLFDQDGNLYFGGANGAKQTGLTINAQPLKDFNNPLVDPQHFEFKGWYTNKRLMTYASATIPFPLNSNVTVRNIFDADAGNMKDYASIWSDDDFTPTYQGGNGTPIVNLYSKVVQTGYSVVYDLNEPGGYSTGNAMPTDEFEIGTDEFGDRKELGRKVDSDYVKTISSNPYTASYPGYTFLGWVLSADAPANTYSTLDAAAASVSGTALGSNYSVASGTLDQNGTGAVTLHAVWKPEGYTVKFYNVYEGDGVLNPTDATAYDTVSQVSWVTPIGLSSSDKELTTDSLYPGSVDYAFVGWYVKKGTDEQAVTLGTDTLGSLYGTYGNGDKTLSVFAKWRRVGVKLIYSAGSDNTVNTNGLTEPGAAFAEELVLVSPTVSTSKTLAIPSGNDRFTKPGYTHTGWVDAESGGNAITKVTFPAGTVDNVTVYPLFAANTYSVRYVYASGDLNMADLTSAKTASGDSLSTVSGLGYASANGVFVDSNYASDPALPGYTFGGWYSDAELTSQVKAPNDSATDTSGVTVASLMTAQGVTDANNAQVNLYAKWIPNAYTVTYDLGGGTFDGASSIDATNVTDYQKAVDGLVPNPSGLMKEHYQNPKWHLTGTYSGRTYDAVVGTELTTYKQLVDAYHEATAAAGARATDIPATLELKASYDQKVVPITYEIESAYSQHAHLVGADIADTTTSSYTINVGEADGTLDGDGSTPAPAITAVGDPAYAVTGWYFDEVAEGNRLTNSASFTLATNGGNDLGTQGGTYYVPAKYVAGIHAGNVSTVAVFRYAGTDGVYHEDGSLGSHTATVTDSLTVDTTMAVADYLSQGEETGFTYDGKASDIVVSADAAANVLNIDYNRNQYNVNYEWAFEAPYAGGIIMKPAKPAATPVYYEADFSIPGAPEATVAGYTWDGWYDKDPTTNADAVKLSGSFTMPASERTLYGYWVRSSYQVEFEGVYESDTDALAGQNALGDPYKLTKRNEGAGNVEVTSGKSVADAVSGFAIYLRDVDTDAVDSDTAQIQIDYPGDSAYVTWMFEKDGTVYSTVDPVNETITQDTVFYAVSSPAQVVAYMKGEHGTFGTLNGTTRSVDIPANYDVADFLYDSAYTYTGEKTNETLSKAAGPLEADAANSDNFGKPVGEPGWKFTGWQWQYSDGDAIVTGSNVGVEDPLHDLTAKTGTALPATLNTSVMFTAQWAPSSSLLVFDLNDDETIAASWVTEGYDDPDGYRHDTNEEVALPAASDVNRPGYTLTGWLWTVEGSDYEYSGTFTMPGAYHDTKTVLKAKWTVDPITVSYASADNNKGTVTPTADPVLTTALPESTEGAGSVATPNGGYTFDGWFKGSVDEANRVSSADEPTFVPQPVDAAAGRYESAAYVASFKPVKLSVQFAVAEGQEEMGSIVDPDGAAPLAVDYKSSLASMGGISAQPNLGYETASGAYWSYSWTDVATGKVVSGITADPTDSSLLITGDATFVAHFVASQGDWTVEYEADGPGYNAAGEKIADVSSASVFAPVKRLFNEANLDAGNVPVATGYDFAGWYDGDTLVASDVKYSQLADGIDDVLVTLGARYTEKTGFSVVFDSNADESAVDAAPVNTAAQPNGNKLTGLTWTTTVNGAGLASSEATNVFTMLNPTWDGHTFLGWTTVADNADADVIDGLAYDDDMQAGLTYEQLATMAGVGDSPKTVTVYAKWLADDFSVVYRDSEGVPEAERHADEVVGDLAIGASVNHKAWDDNDKRAFAGWTYTDAAGNAKAVTSETTVADLVADGAVQDGASFVISATWNDKRSYKTVYVTYDPIFDEATGEIAGYAMNPEANENGTNEWIDDKESHPQLTRGEGVAAPGDQVLPYFLVNAAYGTNDEIPGYVFNATVAREITSSEGQIAWWDPYVMEDADVVFRIPVISEAKYKVKYDMNDNVGAYPGGEIAADQAYSDREVRTFTTPDNIPDAADVDEEYAPTRPGFTFAGWFNQPSDDDGEFVSDVVVEADHATRYGDLSVDENGTWSYPAEESDGYRYITLYAKWIENKHTVQYGVGDEEIAKGVTIKLASEDDDAYSTEARSETIGAASGDLFTADATGKLVRGGMANGAVAKVNDRGYTFDGWYVISGNGDANLRDVLSAANMQASSMRAASLADVAGQVNTVLAAASTRGAVMKAAASSDEALYTTNTTVLPGVNGSNVFPGANKDDANDPDADDVMYVARVTENAPATIVMYPNGDDEPSVSYTQPMGTYLGETEGESGWGENLGGLPTPDPSEDKVFEGWKLAPGTTYEDADGVTHVVPEEGMVIDPDDDIAKRIVVTQELVDNPPTPVWTEEEPNPPAEKVTLSFDGGKGTGATGSVDPITDEAGATVTLPANGFTREGYTFAGWGTDETGKGEGGVLAAGSDYTMPDADSTLYAQWKANEAPAVKSTVTFSAGKDSSVKGSVDPIEAEVGDTIKLPANGFTREGYTFIGWGSDETGKGTGDVFAPGSDYVVTSSEVALYPQWKANESQDDPNKGKTDNNSSSNDSTATKPGSKSSNSTSSVKTGDMLGMTAGALASVSLLALVVLLFVRKRRRADD